jgi:hypothetical protein
LLIRPIVARFDKERGVFMANKDRENEALVATFEKREPGVIDLLEFYAGIETVYAASVKALEEGHTDITSNSTNHE